MFLAHKATRIGLGLFTPEGLNLLRVITVNHGIVIYIMFK